MAKKKRVSKWIYWIPRILAILFILLLVSFSFDVFDTGAGFLESLLGFFIHNIPPLILLSALLISWKKNEIVGAIIFILAGLFYFLLILVNILMSSSGKLIELIWTILITGPALLVGILFFVNWIKKR